MNVGCGAAATGGAGGRGLLASVTAAHPRPTAAATPTASATVLCFARSIVLHPRCAIQTQDGARSDGIVRAARAAGQSNMGPAILPLMSTGLWLGTPAVWRTLPILSLGIGGASPIFGGGGGP